MTVAQQPLRIVPGRRQPALRHGLLQQSMKRLEQFPVLQLDLRDDRRPTARHAPSEAHRRAKVRPQMRLSSVTLR